MEQLKHQTARRFWAARGFQRLSLSTGAFLSILVAIAYFQYGSLRGAVQRLQGHLLGVERHLIDLGEVEAESVSAVEYNVRNLSNAPLQIIGARVDCGCVDASHLPISLSPGASSTLAFKFHAPRSDVSLPAQHEIELYLDQPSPQVSLGFSAVVLPLKTRAPTSAKAQPGS
jgi:hypothetical protein